MHFFANDLLFCKYVLYCIRKYCKIYSFSAVHKKIVKYITISRYVCRVCLWILVLKFQDLFYLNTLEEHMDISLCYLATISLKLKDSLICQIWMFELDKVNETLIFFRLVCPQIFQYCPYRTLNLSIESPLDPKS